MDDAISQKGTKTRARQATHGSLIVSAQQCPKCGCRHVLKAVALNVITQGDYFCASCAHIWRKPVEAL